MFASVKRVPHTRPTILEHGEEIIFVPDNVLVQFPLQVAGVAGRVQQCPQTFWHFLAYLLALQPRRDHEWGVSQVADVWHVGSFQDTAFIN